MSKFKTVVTKFIKDNGFRRLRKPYQWQNVGVSRIATDMTLASALSHYAKTMQLPALAWLARLLPNLIPKHFASTCSFINTFLKLAVDAIGNVEHWIPFIDLQTMVGYPKLSDRIFKEDIRKWLVGEKVSGYHSDYLRVIKEILPHTSNAPFKWQTFNDYLFARYTWMTQGSDRTLRVTSDDKVIGTKTSLAFSASDKLLLKVCSVKYITQKGLRAFVKPDERGPKGRYIINAPTGLFIKQKYIYEKLLSRVTPDSRLTMLSGPEMTHQLIHERLNSSFLIPLDESSFDYNVTTDQWLAFFDFLNIILPDEVDLIHELKSYLGTLPVFDVDGKFLGTWQHGMPSGFMWTAFLDSLFNLTKQILLSEELPIKPVCAQGDDALLVADEKIDLALIEAFYAKHLASVERSKNWISSSSAEYLKQLFSNGRVYQYPARSFSSCMWKYPDFRDNAIDAKMNELATVWKEFYDRAGFYDVANIINQIHAGVVNRLHFSKQLIEEWLFTIPALGGFGLTPCRARMQFKVQTKRYFPKLAVNGKRFVTRYPWFKSVTVKVSANKINIDQMLRAPSGKGYSMRYYLGTDTPSWTLYVEYLRAINGLPNALGLQIITPADKRLPANPRFVTPLFLKTISDPTSQRGFTRILSYEADKINQIVEAIPLPQLWK